jgi:hypothetical protein
LKARGDGARVIAVAHIYSVVLNSSRHFSLTQIDMPLHFLVTTQLLLLMPEQQLPANVDME